MCGIAGQIKFNKSEVSLLEIRQMTDALAHRGPDGEGHWINESKWVGLGHRRLSIIDLSSAGKQPMHYKDRYTIIFNGEIYNYIEIREKLTLLGYTFVSKTDTEVLVALYDLKSEKCLEELDGMFSFVIYDEIEQKIFVARDRFGEKPFFYYLHNEVLYFASEIKAFWALGLPKQPDMETTFYFMHYGRVHHPFNLESTFFKNVKKLKAAHYMIIKKGEISSIKQHNYWQLTTTTINESQLNLKDTENNFFELFKNSVLRRLRSDVPIGSSLSGGLDSSAVVCMINYLNKNKNIHQSTFSARFPGYIKDEGKFMEMVIKETDAKSFYTYPDQDGFIKNFERLCYYQDEPFGSASIYAQYEVMNLANQNGVTVLLDGQGADEMLGGYSFYLETLSKEHISFENKEKTLTQKLKSFFPRTYGIYHKRKLTKKLISDLKLKGYGEYLIEVATKIDIPEEIHLNLHAHLCHDLTKGNLEDLLRYADRNSMAFSREIRLPFLDKEFVEFVMSLPSSYKINGEWSKWIQRLAFQNILPHEITWRTDKIGYEPPQKNWMFDIRVQEKIRESKIKLYKEGIITKIESERKAEATEANQISDNSWYQMMAANLF